jgi:exopolysaccharide biosynthesis WecB/TagA/CpsF family protein
VYFYGSTPEIVGTLAEQMAIRFPGLQVAGFEPSRFAPAGPAEWDEIAERIRASGARIVFVGLGCPRQELWASALSDRLGMPAVCVGTAFDYHAVGEDAPMWMQRSGLQWLWRLAREPRRLWRRYLLLNPAYVGMFLAQLLRLWRPDTAGRAPDPNAPVPA